MKLTPKQINDICTVIDHSRLDINYGAGGSFGDGNDFDSKQIKSANRGIELIKKLIMTNQ